MARRADSTNGFSGSTVMPSGLTWAQEIFNRTGRTARALPSQFRFGGANNAGEVPWGPEDIIRRTTVDVLKHGNFDDDVLWLDQDVSTSTGVNPFTRMGRITSQKMDAFITNYDKGLYDYDASQGNVLYQTTAGPHQYVAPVSDPEDPQYIKTSPAPLSEVPTSTTAYSAHASKPGKPRTVGAGFIVDAGSDKGKLTVVFRDGTYYNYYDVDVDTWEEFKSQQNKGAFIKEHLDHLNRGPATDIAMNTPESAPVREELYRILRSVQATAKGRKQTSRERTRQTAAQSPQRANPKPRNSYRLTRARTR